MEEVSLSNSKTVLKLEKSMERSRAQQNREEGKDQKAFLRGGQSFIVKGDGRKTLHPPGKEQSNLRRGNISKKATW